MMKDPENYYVVFEQIIFADIMDEWRKKMAELYRNRPGIGLLNLIEINNAPVRRTDTDHEPSRTQKQMQADCIK